MLSLPLSPGTCAATEVRPVTAVTRRHHTSPDYRQCFSAQSLRLDGTGAYLGMILLASSAVEGQRLPNCAVSNCVKLLCRRSVLPVFNQGRRRSNGRAGGLRTDNANRILRREFAKQVDVFHRLIEHTVRIQCCSISCPRFSSRG